MNRVRFSAAETRLDFTEQVWAEQIQAWYVVGDAPCRYYPTKLIAETIARELFPNEDPDRRYARIYYRIFERQT